MPAAPTHDGPPTSAGLAEDSAPSPAAQAAGGPDLRDAFPFVYDELRRLAASYLAREGDGHTLQPTALVHEAYFRLAAQRRLDPGNRAQVLALGAEMMRRILVNHAEARRAQKRGGAGIRVPLDETVGFLEARDADLIALDDALRRLSELDPRGSRIVELRYFGGLGVDETAAVLGVSTATVKRDWTVARAWLRRALEQP
jgi:RNA polymerase sigma factor (TIGR02999 family)